MEFAELLIIVALVFCVVLKFKEIVERLEVLEFHFFKDACEILDDDEELDAWCAEVANGK